MSATQPVRIRVATAQPYDVLVGRGLLGELTEQLADASKVALIHP
ncbi:3-dehydroquinate synthase, partial [Amycolatopsis sp. NPDC000673]